MERLSITKLANKIQTEADAYVFMEGLRWGNPARPVCPHCSATKVYFLNPANGHDRVTGINKSRSVRRVWKCAACRKQFSVLTGTIFHGTKVALRTWLFVVFEMCASENGVSAREVERKYDLTPKTAWFVLHRIREAMKREPLAGMLSGTVVADETWIGGKERNKHHQNKPRTTGKPGGKGSPFAGKTAVLSLVDKGTGEVRSHVVANVDGTSLRKVIAEHVDMAGSTLHTDAGRQYRPLGHEFIDHQWVDHTNNEYVRGGVSTNAAEGYFSQLKRSIDGTHHRVSVEHLPRYLAEFDYRYTTRKMSDTARMEILMSRVDGRRLSYRKLNG